MKARSLWVAAELAETVPGLECENAGMIAAVSDHISEVEALCRRFGVRRLVVFGSAVNGTFQAGLSDVDFLVESDPPAGQSRFDAFVGLNEILDGRQ